MCRCALLRSCGCAAVQNAALNGHSECVQLLIDAGARPDIYTSTGLSPLYAAAQGGFGDALVDILGSKHMTRAIADYNGNGNGATALCALPNSYTQHFLQANPLQSPAAMLQDACDA